MTLGPGFKTTHDRMGSIMSLARVMLQGIVPEKQFQVVQTESLRLVLETLIECGTPASQQEAGAEARRTVEGMIAPKLLTEDTKGSGRGWI